MTAQPAQQDDGAVDHLVAYLEHRIHEQIDGIIAAAGEPERLSQHQDAGLDRATRCNGYCHGEDCPGTCEECDSGIWEFLCDGCRDYAQDDAEPIDG